MSSRPQLRGRDNECDILRQLASDVRAGRSRVLVLRGAAGIGKTALLKFLIGRAHGCMVSCTAGVDSEMELPYSGLHQVCGPLMKRPHELPPPQRDALSTAFGLRTGAPPDRFLVGLAALTLLTDVAEEQPLLCVVDDMQWLDQASVQILEFVARRLGSERVGLVFGVREPTGRCILTGLPEVTVQGLNSANAEAILKSAVPGRLDASILDRILAESHGNPLALLELPRELSSTELTFGSPRTSDTDADGLVRRLEQGFLRQWSALCEPSRELLVLAAAEPTGDVPLLWRAAEDLGLPLDAVIEAEREGLLELRERVRFRHPLVRSAVYRAATAQERRHAHEALAAVTDSSEDPDRRAWHRAHATVGTDEAVAAELQRSADRALRRGGVAAAAACLEAAAALTPDPTRRAQRSLVAAQAKATAGAFEDALALLATAQAGPLDDSDRARIALVQAQIVLHSRHGNQGLPMLLAAARQVESIDPGLAHATYLDAMTAAIFAGRLAAGSANGMRQVAEAVSEVRLPPVPSKPDLLLRHIALIYTDSYSAAAPRLRSTVEALGTEPLTTDEAVRFAWLAACAATDLWDDVNWDVLTRRHLDAIRDVGALSALPVALTSRAIYALMAGDLAEAESLIAEGAWVADITGGQNAMLSYGEACLDAMRGDASRAEPKIHQLFDEIKACGEGVGLNVMGWFQAALYNSLGRYPDALVAATVATAEPLELGPPKWALGELVEAAVRSGRPDAAAVAFEQLSTYAQASGTDVALGIEAGRRALLRHGKAAEECYREAIERLKHTRVKLEHARAQLLYGEWLRRDGRRVAARSQLRAAYEAFASMGVNGFAERARLELGATGETVHARSVATVGLTAQESHIARLAADGLTNKEIGGVLYISAKTVEWHLRKVFAKLGIAGRRELRHALQESTQVLRA